jgi:gluconate 5-dehydrogenase
MQLFNLEGKIAIVTGGYGHLGSAMVRALAIAGAKVIVAGRSKDKYESKFTTDEKKQLVFMPIDITQLESIQSLFDKVFKEFGRIDILVNNAHTARGSSQEKMDDADWAYTMDGVVGSVHRCIKAVLPIMKNQQSGKIINITSMYGMVSPDFSLYKGDNCEMYTNPPHYGAAKAAMNQVTRYFAVLLGQHNVQVNGIAPGPFPKPEIQTANPKFVERLSCKNPLNRIGKPDDLAGVTLLLSSSASDFITGQIIQVDGGWTIW